MTFPDDEQGRAAEQVVRRVMELLPQLIRERQQETLNKLTDALLVGVTTRSACHTSSDNGIRPIRSICHAFAMHSMSAARLPYVASCSPRHLLSAVRRNSKNSSRSLYRFIAEPAADRSLAKVLDM